MKIIEAMKKIKDLQRKCSDLQELIAKSCADLDYETPLYPDQKLKVMGWVQAHTDLVHLIGKLREDIQRTNLTTQVTIDIGGKEVTKTISAWIFRRRDLAQLESLAWAKLSDRGLKEGRLPTTTGEAREVKIRRYYDPERRDKQLDVLRSEPLLIDAKLEVVNAVTDLIETAA